MPRDPFDTGGLTAPISPAASAGTKADIVFTPARTRVSKVIVLEGRMRNLRDQEYHANTCNSISSVPSAIRTRAEGDMTIFLYLRGIVVVEKRESEWSASRQVDVIGSEDRGFFRRRPSIGRRA